MKRTRAQVAGTKQGSSFLLYSTSTDKTKSPRGTNAPGATTLNRIFVVALFAGKLGERDFVYAEMFTVGSQSLGMTMPQFRHSHVRRAPLVYDQCGQPDWRNAAFTNRADEWVAQPLREVTPLAIGLMVLV